jgi:hypothetical protein
MASMATIQLPPLARKSMTELVDKASRMGIAPGEYAKQLIEDGLAFQREAEEFSFAQIMKPVRNAAGDVDDVQIMRLVETARAQHHTGGRRKKR